MIARRGDRYGTKLVSSPREAQQLTANSSHDALTALRRGLAEYLLHHMPRSIGARDITLESVMWGWATFETRGRFPAAYVSQRGDVQYASTTTARGSSFRADQAGKPRLDVVADVTATMEVHIYAKDSVQRMALVRGVESAFYPEAWLDGLRLKLDFYHDAFASYALESVSYDDSVEDAQEAYRRAVVTCSASLPLVVTRPAKAGITPRAKLTASPTVVVTP